MLLASANDLKVNRGLRFPASSLRGAGGLGPSSSRSVSIPLSLRFLPSPPERDSDSRRSAIQRFLILSIASGDASTTIVESLNLAMRASANHVSQSCLPIRLRNCKDVCSQMSAAASSWCRVIWLVMFVPLLPKQALRLHQSERQP